jgi:hypothetical protein
VEKEGWSIVATADLSVKSLPGFPPNTALSYSEAEQSLRVLVQADPKQAGGLKILRLSEVAVPVP